MKILGIFFLVLILFLFFGGTQFLWKIRRSNDVVLSSKTFSQEKSDSSYQVLVIGDSTGAGVGAINPQESVVGRLFTDFPFISVKNVSENGLRLKQVTEKLRTVEHARFNFIIIQAGGNDVIRLTPLHTLEKQLEEIFIETKKRADYVAFLPAGNVGLAPIFSWPINKILTARSRAVRKMYIKKTKEHGVFYADFFTEREGDIFLTDIKRYYSKDIFHPSGDGYRIWYEIFLNTLKENGVAPADSTKKD